MTEPDDIALLREWKESRSEAAFRRLVERYAPLVWGAALRKVGEHAFAEEAVQQVFADLAGKAAVLVELRRPLAPWLHRAAVFEAVQVLRREIRHRDRMKNYADTAPDAPSAPDPWEDVRPHLDEAINSLGETDRRVLLLHWFERRTFAEVALELDCTPAAAQRRGLRALDKLAASLRRRGAVASTSVLAAGLTLALTPPVPAAVLTGMCSAAAGAAVSMPSPLLTFHKCLHAMSTAKLTTAAVVLISAAIPVSVRFAEGKGRNGTNEVDGTYETHSSHESHSSGSEKDTSTALDLSLIQQAIRRLLDNSDDYQTQLDLRRLMFSLTAEEIPAVEKLLMAVSGKRKEALNEVVHAFFARWAELDPAAATRAAFAMSKSAYGFYPIRGAFVTWAAADLDSAWNWLEKTTSNPMDREFLGGEALATIIAFRNNGAEMMARVDAMKDVAWRKQLRYWVLRSWVQHDAPRTVMDWALQLPADAERDERIAQTVEQIGTHRPDCLSFIDHIENPARRAEVGHNILWPYLLARDPSTTCSPPDFVQDMQNLTEKYPPDFYRDTGDALGRHGANWAMQKLGELPAGAARDEFIQGMLTSAAFTQAKAMLPAVAMLSEEALIRHGGLSHFSDVLTKQDPRAAAEWITSLPPDSHVREWAGSHFQSITGRNAADYLNSLTK